jgi:ribonucleoside-diphosphate reductase beta chain
MPSYSDLYRRWETQQWSVYDLDFSPDRTAWLSASRSGRRSMLWTSRLFFNGEERVTATLTPFIDAAPTPEIAIFLTTQLVDEARHTLFFERWWREVPGTTAPDLAQLIDENRPLAGDEYNELFYERLPGIAARIRADPEDRGLLVEGVTLYHIVIEATLALTGQRFRLEAMREFGYTNLGFYRGFIAVARDESRHVNFGVKFLQEAIQSDPRRFAPIVQRTVTESLPLIAATLRPPGGDDRYFTDFGSQATQVWEFALASLNKRLRAIGVRMTAR